MPDCDAPVEELFHVTVRKYGIDADSPWWRRMFFRMVYLPFVRFAFRRFSIPAPERILKNGDFEWVEGIGIATDQEIAMEMCKGEFYRVAALPVNCALPERSFTYKGHVYPKSIVPDRYRRRTFPFALHPIADEKKLMQLNEQADRIVSVIRSSAVST